MPDSKSSLSPPLPPYLENFINKYQISTCSRTPINIPALSSELVSHPDCHFVNTLLDNLNNGCNINYTRSQFNHCSRNLHSAYQHPLFWMPPLLRNASLADFWGHLTSPRFPRFAPQALDWCPSMMAAGEPYATCQLLTAQASITTLTLNYSPLPTVQWMTLMLLLIPWEPVHS